MLRGLAGKVTTASEAATLTDALTTPPNSTSPHTDEQRAARRRRLDATAATGEHTGAADLVDSLNAPSSYGNSGKKLDAPEFTNIGPLKCCTCGAAYRFNAREQAFYNSKQFGDQVMQILP